MKKLMQMKGVVCGCLLLLAGTGLMGCYSKPYFDRNGKKFRNVNEAAEEWHVDSSVVATYGFNLQSYFDGKTSEDPKTQFILPKDVNEVLDHTNKLLVIVYNPERGGSSRDLQLAKHAEENNMPYLLISMRYSPAYIDHYINSFGLKNKNRYIIPSGYYFSHILIRKQGQFWAQVAPELYGKYRDELTKVSYMILKKEKQPISNLANQYPEFKASKEWLDKNW